MPDAPPRRRRLQLHLSTCVLLMFACGALMWLSFRTRDKVIEYDATIRIGSRLGERALKKVPVDLALLDPKVQALMIYSELMFHSTTFKFTFQGWPWDHRVLWEDETGYDKSLAGSSWYTSDLLKNATCALGILAGLAVACEFLARRAGASETGRKPKE